MVQWKRIRLGTMRLRVPSLALLSGLGIRRCRELWCRLQTWLDPALLWLWCRPAAAAPIRPLAWEFPYATDVALKKKKERERELEGGLAFRGRKGSLVLSLSGPQFSHLSCGGNVACLIVLLGGALHVGGAQ